MGSRAMASDMLQEQLIGGPLGIRWFPEISMATVEMMSLSTIHRLSR